MARPARGAEVLEMAQEMILCAKTIEELRQAQAVVLPLAYGLSLEQTARVIGRSVVWTCRLRNRFLAGETVGDGQRQRPGGRRRENLSLAREREILDPFLGRASNGGLLVVPQIKAELEAALGRPMALSSVYNRLHRHGWRKLAPDKRHPQSDPAAQDAWKKTPRHLSCTVSLIFSSSDVRFSATRTVWKAASDGPSQAEVHGGDRPRDVPLHRGEPRAGGRLWVREAL